MCGIHLVTSSNPSTALEAVNKMVATTTHRGPDGTHASQVGNVTFGFNRLMIVGGSQGEQPIMIETKGLTLIGNGEIFNYKELDEGFDYKTTSDLEIILHLYDKYATSFLERLEGQFSFALHDSRKKQIVFARDRWGITPLFYSLKPDLVLSSSIKALIKSGLLESDVTLDPQGIAEQWFLYGPTPPRTIFKGIHQLAPGSVALYNLEKSSLITEHYADALPQTNKEKASPQTLRDALTQSVQKRLQGEYGPGVYVSGGVDSSIIASLVARVGANPKLFSISFTDAEYDESPYQRKLAEYLDCELQSVHIETKDIISHLDECLAYTESPLIRTAPVPMMLLSHVVRGSGLKYILCGEGADELFAGYPVFQKGLSSVADKKEEALSFARYFQNKKECEAAASVLKSFSVNPSLLNLRREEIDTKLSRYLLANQGDRVSMANSIEQRFPFLDSSVAQIASGLEDDKLIHNGNGKWILRKAFEDYLPDELLYRKKQGYLTPDVGVAKALQKSPGFREALSEEACNKYGIFNYANIQKLLESINTTAEARFILFAYTTHRLVELMVEN